MTKIITTTRIRRLDWQIVRWILARASAVYQDQPALTYEEIARRLRRARGIALSRHQVRRLVQAEDPELHKWRVEAAR